MLTNPLIPSLHQSLGRNHSGDRTHAVRAQGAKGKIFAVYTEPVQGAQEVAPNDPALAAFIHDNIPSTDPDDDWARSELGLVRVIEDLI